VAEVKEVTVPDIGDFTGVPVIEVLVAAGDTIAPEDPLVTLESDKATMDVPAPFGGTVSELRVKVGDEVSEGDVLLTVEVGDEPEGAEDGSEAADERPAEDEGETEREPEPASARNGSGAEVYASPSVRRLARQERVDLGAIEGTGPRGRITPEDVRRGPSETAPATSPADGGEGLGLAPWPKVDFEKYGEVERVPLSRIRKLAGANLARNWVRIPHVTHHEDADVTELEAFRKQLNAEQSDVKVTMVALLLKASAATLREFPDVNASLDGDELVRKKYVHLGFAADTPNGLVVPVIRDVDRKGVLELAGELTALSGKAREGKLSPGEMAGATFTISSLGGIGGTGFTPIINAPEVAILGASRTATKPVWDGAAFVPRLILPLSLSYDHRVIDGAAAARFCAHLAKVLADLRRVLL
jgi:pyruvate dehydrogenase E2 component (dihydrolipoamide acetyltransferase)